MKKTTLALLLGAACSVASASFVDESRGNPFAMNAQMRVIGAGGNDVIHGFARATPLHEAINQIVPRSFSVRSIGVERLVTTPVDWQGGRAWVDVLRDTVAQVPSIQVEIDIQAKQIVLSQQDAAVQAVVEGASPVAVARAIEAPSWDIRSEDQTVRAVFERWSRAAGWQLVWDLPIDYPLSATASLNGSFEEVVERVMRSMQASNQPPKAIFYRGNYVLRIVDRGME